MKYYAAILFAAAAMFGLSACKSQPSAEAPQPAPAEAQAAPAPDAATATTDTESAPPAAGAPVQDKAN